MPEKFLQNLYLKIINHLTLQLGNLNLSESGTVAVFPVKFNEACDSWLHYFDSLKRILIAKSKSILLINGNLYNFIYGIKTSDHYWNANKGNLCGHN